MYMGVLMQRVQNLYEITRLGWWGRYCLLATAEFARLANMNFYRMLAVSHGNQLFSGYLFLILQDYCNSSMEGRKITAVRGALTGLLGRLKIMVS